jgi:LemA protein
MDTIVNFFISLFQLAIFVAIVLGIIAFLGYNKLRALSESIKEAWSNIGVVGRKQASLINQLIDVVKGYQESEKLVMLKVSEDMSNTANVAQMYQQSGVVLSSVNGLAEKFPELKANQQYQRLIDSIQSCESQLEEARAAYNRTVRNYNTSRSSIPTIFYAPVLGFTAAPYLEFDGNNQIMDMGTLKSFSADSDGERLNALLGNVGSRLLEVSGKTINVGKAVAVRAVEEGRILVEKTQGKIEEIRSDSQEKSESSDSLSLAKKPCGTCSADVNESVSFCSNCGTKVAS